jgi:hypothetical protein
MALTIDRQIVAEGRPKQVAKVAASHTGKSLAPLLAHDQMAHGTYSPGRFSAVTEMAIG